MKKKRLILAALILMLSSLASAVGTVTVTMTTDSHDSIVKYTAAWVSDENGDVSGNGSDFSVVARGKLMQAQFIPDGGGTQPTDLYDATLTYNSVDVLNSQGADLSNSTGLIVLFDPPIFYDGSVNMDLVISNAGDSKGGTFSLWVRTD